MRLKEQRGSITVEASISLTAFIFFIITILLLINIARLQARMATALNYTAKEIGQYSYIYGVSGLGDLHAANSKRAEEASSNIGGIMSTVNDLYNSIQLNAETGESTNIEDIGNFLEDIDTMVEGVGGSLTELESQIEALFEDPKKTMLGIGSILANEAINEATSKIIVPVIAKKLFQKHFISEGYDNADEYLRKLGVVNGMNGLDFTNSRLLRDGEHIIEINVVYTVKTVQLLPVKNEFTFYQSASTIPWLMGE